MPPQAVSRGGNAITPSHIYSSFFSKGLFGRAITFPYFSPGGRGGRGGEAVFIFIDSGTNLGSICKISPGRAYKDIIEA
jgi:hypothetical protein